MSGLFQQVMYHIGIEQVLTTLGHKVSLYGSINPPPPHLQKTCCGHNYYCGDTEKELDEGVHLVLFATQEAVQDSLEFSQFELIFRQDMCGPLKLIKEAWLGTDNNVNLLDRLSSIFNCR